MPDPVLISVDWGTSSLRGFLLADNGEVIDSIEQPKGIMKIEDRDFASFFKNTFKQWLNNNLPILLSGMIGSDQGWSLAPQLPVPIKLETIAASLHPVSDTEHKIYIVSGLSYVNSDGYHDLIRGEETQIFGAMEELQTPDSIMCLPGTHSKWVSIQGSSIADFHTSFTGEAFATLIDHTILGRLMESTLKVDDFFLLGLKRAQNKGGLLHHLFSVRSQGVCGKIPKSGLQQYLAGILIGHEIIGMNDFYPDCDQITVIGSSNISELYVKALSFFKIDSVVIDGTRAAYQGQLQLARTAGILKR